jgi:hypothetical protein
VGEGAGVVLRGWGCVTHPPPLRTAPLPSIRVAPIQMFNEDLAFVLSSYIVPMQRPLFHPWYVRSPPPRPPSWLGPCMYAGEACRPIIRGPVNPILVAKGRATLWLRLSCVSPV